VEHYRVQQTTQMAGRGLLNKALALVPFPLAKTGIILLHYASTYDTRHV
jgi:hypothetical protein